MAEARVWTRLDGVDVLRGLAIFFVLMNHVNMRLVIASVPYTEGLPEQLVHSLVWNGRRGVQMFFAVSGFLITAMALRRWGSLEKIRVGHFFRLRFARIMPLLLLLLGILSLLHFAGVEHFVVPAKTGGLGRALVAALTFHVNVLEARSGYLPGNWDVLWSLSVEEVFYLFFPLIARLLGRSKLLLGLLLGFVALGPVARTTLAYGNEVWKEYSYLGGIDAIALGCITAILLSRLEISRSALWVIGTAGTAIVTFCLGFSLQADRLLALAGLDMTVLAMGTCMVIATAATTKWRGPRAIQPLLRLGRHSYEIYLTHMFVVFAVFQVFLVMGRQMRFVPVLFIVVVVVAALLGEMVARAYSEPLNRLLREGRRDASQGIEPAVGSAERAD
jgi:peptidoglycan/LPS O-acetylase OafA/YrhL